MDYVKVTSKGSYFVGGEKVTIEGTNPIQMELWPGGPLLNYDPNGDFQAGQMYVQYTRLADPVVPYPVCMVHGGGGTGALWETTQSGEPGWEYMFLSYAERWTTYRLGPKYPESYEGTRFDADKYDAFIKSQVPRWTTSIPMAQKAYDQYVGSMTDGCIMLAHSQGGLFTVNAVLEHPENVKAVVLIESSSTIDVDKTDVSAFKDIPFLFVWGDYLGEEYCTPDYRWIGDFAYQGTMRKLHERILELGGDSTWMHLPEMGIRGNTHAMMQENNSRQIADLVCDWLVKKVPCGSK